MDIQKKLLALREHAKGNDIAFLMRGGDVAFSSGMDGCIRQIMKAQSLGKPLGFPTNMFEYFDTIQDQLRKAGLADSEIKCFSSRFGKSADVTVLTTIALVFELDIGFSWAPGLVGLKCPDLEFDDDGLLIGPSNTVDFAGPRNPIHVEGGQPVDRSFSSTKVGVAYRNLYVIPFHNNISRYNIGLSGGFLRLMSNFVAEHTDTSVGVKISDNTLLDRSSFRDLDTRAYIRGPKSISPTKLQSDSFPENSRGDVTEHRLLDDGSPESLLSDSFFPTLGFQVLWSRNGNLKTCQAEELVRPDNTTAKDSGVVFNRYVHAIWDTTKCRFSHFDGAIRGYAEQDYAKRVSSDIKNSRELSKKYIKLWRLDGEIPFKNWADLLAKYFQGHNLATEYLEAAF